jgi:REP element-mobilizing transposase RayT
MQLPPIIAYHIVWSTYGFWLPNEERGSWSKQVWAPKLIRFGPPIPANTNRSLARNPYDRARRREMIAELKFPPVKFAMPQIECVARAIGEEALKYQLPVYAAAIMPDHVHMVIARQAQYAEKWVGYFKRAASRDLRETGLHPFLDRQKPDGSLPTPWVAGGWKVFLHNDEEIIRTINYVNLNPEKAGLPPQHWEYVTPYQPRLADAFTNGLPGRGRPG